MSTGPAKPNCCLVMERMSDTQRVSDTKQMCCTHN